MSKPLSLPVLAAVALGLSGCGAVYKPTGQVLSHYAQDEIVPFALASGDLDLASCGTGLALHQLMASFGGVMAPPTKITIATNTLAGLCAEAQAQEADLRSQRALQAGDAAEARDARVLSQRLYRRTALRRLQVYHDTVESFGEFGGSCPDLGNDTDRVEFLIGVLTSVQALLSDIQAGNSAGVPMDVAARAGRAATCFDNERWWGVPKALEAVVWLSVPGTLPAGIDPWKQLAEAANLGESQRMPMAAMLYAIAAYGTSETEREKEAIRQAARIYNKHDAPQDSVLLSEVAYMEVLFLSDRIWTRETGQRTPFLRLGDFPDDSSSDSNLDTTDLLD